MTQAYGLIGYPLGHSFSERFFTEKFAREGIRNAVYRLYPLPDLSGFRDLLRNTPGLRGLNVTIPHKVAVVPLLDELDETARFIGAVNTITVDAQGRTKGYNTDAHGFLVSLERWIPDLRQRPLPALVFGSGGASRAVRYAFDQLGVPHTVVSRGPEKNAMDYAALPGWLSGHPDALLINTTPVGMHPDAAACLPLPWAMVGSGHFVYDLIYNPAETLLLQRARRQGASVKNGLDMLILQAERAWHIWQHA
ncbi:MAG: shikimate dehydrogenase [Saprospiraceae bacterium]|nr:shikimate dehydrogenase [Saprospiraceae bacterium]